MVPEGLMLALIDGREARGELILLVVISWHVTSMMFAGGHCHILGHRTVHVDIKTEFSAGVRHSVLNRSRDYGRGGLIRRIPEILHH